MFDCYLICLCLKVIAFLTALVLLFVIGLRLWLGPIKGVCTSNARLDGKVVIVTGGSLGIGVETARDLARRGARVVIASRNVKKGNEVVTDIIATTNNPKVEFKSLDLSKFSSIINFVKDFNENYERLDILVNNAGVAGIRQAYTEDGIEKIMQVNYVGPFLLTHLLMEKLKSSRPSRIVIVSSIAHRSHKLDPNDIIGKRPLDYWVRYSNSKVCNILWAKALAKRLPEGITVNSLNPGLVKTDIFHRYSKIRQIIVLLFIDLFFKTPVEGAQTTMHLCVAPELENVSGQYFSECKIEEPQKIVKDDLVVEKVWAETMLLIKDKLNNN